MSESATTCPYCGVGCGLLVSDGGEIRADPDHPANFGRICSKGAALGETIGLERRILLPRIEGRPASWDRALDLVAARFAGAIREHGPESVAFYVSGQILTEDYYVANKLMKGFIGAANIDTNSRLCMASTVAGHRRAFGADTVPCTYEDLELADLVVLVGSNLAWCHPVLFQRLLAAREARPEMRIVVIDPRRTATAEAADLHLPVAPDGDIALFNALLAEIDRRGACAPGPEGGFPEGMEEALAAARAGRGAPSGLAPEAQRRFIDMWIATPRVVTLWSQGVNQSACGTDKVNAIINCHLATGRIGRPGCGPFSVTGQPNAMGGREVGGLANTLACHLEIENPAHRAAVQAHWRSPRICTRPGLKAVDLFAACGRGEIRALWIIGTNPAASMPDADAVRDAIARVPFRVVSEVTETDTTALAHVILPATAWGEKTGTVTNSERRISLQRAFLPAPGQARPDWRIICDVAARMGWQRAFSYRNVAEIFREHAALSGRAAALGSDFDISALAGISDSDYAAFRPVQWPVPAAGRTAQTRNGRFFARGRFLHEGGRARMVPLHPPAAGGRAGAEEFRLNSGRLRDQWHMMSRTGLSPRLGRHSPEPLLEIHPEDARRLGIAPGALVELVSPRGRAVLRAQPSTRQRPGEIFAPMHWSGQNSAGGRVNALIPPACDRLSGQPALKGALVRLRPFPVRWHGFAASAAPMRPRGEQAAIARTETGWRCETASLRLPDDWEEEARRVLGLAGGSASLLLDPARGIFRVAIHEGGRVRGLFFAGSGQPQIDRNHVIGLIGSDLPALAALSGQAQGAGEDPGPTVCACLSVGRETLRRAIRAGATSIAALGRHTAAGTACGSCRPELEALLGECGADVPATAAE